VICLIVRDFVTGRWREGDAVERAGRAPVMRGCRTCGGTKDKNVSKPMSLDVRVVCLSKHHARLKERSPVAAKVWGV